MTHAMKDNGFIAKEGCRQTNYAKSPEAIRMTTRVISADDITLLDNEGNAEWVDGNDSKHSDGKLKPWS